MLNLLVVTAGLFLALSEAHTTPFLKEKVSVEMLATGGLNNRYSFDGALGDELLGTPNESPERCEVRARFARVVISRKNQLDLRLKIECNEQGFKKTYRPPRLHLDLETELQRKKIGFLSPEMTGIDLVFEGLSIRKSK